MGRSFGRGTGKETNPVIINKEFTMSGPGWCPGLDYGGNPESCFIGCLCQPQTLTSMQTQ